MKKAKIKRRKGERKREEEKERVREEERENTNPSSPYCTLAASNVSFKNKIKMFSCRFFFPFWRDTGIAKRVPDSTSICLFF